MTGLTRDNPLLSEVTCPACREDHPAPFAVNCKLLEVDNDAERVRKLVQAATSPNTRRAYRSDLAHFLANGGSFPSSADKVAKYLAHHSDKLSVATLARRLVAIGRAHSSQNLDDPCRAEIVRMTLRGIRRTYGRLQRRAQALTKEQIRSIVATLGNSPRDLRDRALLLVGFYGAFRRSELCAVDCKSIDRSKAGILITIRKSKTDQEKKGRDVAIWREEGSMCPVNALDGWLLASGIADGPIFRPLDRAGRIRSCTLSGEAVSGILKNRMKAAGFNPTNYSGHSLRAGYVTAAVNAGMPTWRIRRQTGHASDAMLDRYIRQATAFSDPWQI